MVEAMYVGSMYVGSKYVCHLCVDGSIAWRSPACTLTADNKAHYRKHHALYTQLTRKQYECWCLEQRLNGVDVPDVQGW